MQGSIGAARAFLGPRALLGSIIGFSQIELEPFHLHALFERTQNEKTRSVRILSEKKVGEGHGVDVERQLEVAVL